MTAKKPPLLSSLALSRLSPQSVLGGARSISALPIALPHTGCQVARFAPPAAAAARLEPAAIQATGTRGEGARGAEPPANQFHA